MFDSLRHRLLGRRGQDLPPADDVFEDAGLSSLAEELSGLGRLDLPAAPRERTWAVVRAEVQKQEARGAFARRGVASGRLGRLAVGGAALVTAVTLGVVGLTGGFNGSNPTARNTSSSGQVIAGGGSSTDTLAPGTSATDPSSTQPSQPPVDTGSPSTEPSSTEPPSTDSTSTPTGSVPSHGGSGTTVPVTSPEPKSTTTLAPATSTTAGGGVLTREERESSAVAVAWSLGDKIVTGNVSGAESLVTDGARRGLVQMVASLSQPYSYRIVRADVGDTTARVVIEILDRIPDSDGDGFVEKAHRYSLDMQSQSDGSLLITRISAAPAE